MKQVFFVSIWFQIVWLCAVLGQETLQYLTLILVIATLLVSAYKVNFNWLHYFSLLALGLSLDMVNVTLGLFLFEAQAFPLWLAALWMIFIWYSAFLYPLICQFSLPLVSLVGGVAGALSYLAGAKLGAVTFGVSTLAITAVLWLQWTLFIGFLVWIYGYENSSKHHKFSRVRFSSDK